MAFDYLAELTAQAQRFVLSPPTAGATPLVYSFTLSPPSGLVRQQIGGRPPQLMLSAVDVVREEVEVGRRETTVNLPLVGRWVRLPPDLVSETPIGGMPVAAQVPEVSGTLSGPTTGLTGAISTTLTTRVPPPGLMTSVSGQAAEPGVPALLGRVTGLVVETLRELRDVMRALDPIVVRAAARIRVVDDGDPASTAVTSLVQISIAGGTWGPLSPAPLTVAGPLSFSLRIPPLFSELKAAAPEVVRLSVHVSVDLELTPPAPPPPAPAPAPVRATFDLPPVPLVLPTIPVPTVVVLCEHPNFLGRKLVVVPSDSLIGKALTAGGRPVGDALALSNQAVKAVQSALGAGAGAVAFAGFLDSAGLGAPGMASAAIAQTIPRETAAAVLTSLAEVPGQTIIVASSQLTTLGNFVFDPGGFLDIGRFTASLMASSVIVVGRPGTTVAFEQHAGWPFRQELTPLTITLGAAQLACAVSLLGPPGGFGVGVIVDPSDPEPFTTTVFGGAITTFSPKQGEDEISAVAITRPPAGLMLAT